MVKKNLENRPHVNISDQIHILKPRKPTKAVINDFGWSDLAQKLAQGTLKIISDQLIFDRSVVGFSPEAHPMDPKNAFPTDSFPTTLRSFLQLGPTAEPWTSLPTNTFPTVIGRFWDNPRVWHVNGGPDLSDTIHMYKDMATHLRPKKSVGYIPHFGPISHSRLGLKHYTIYGLL